MRDNEVLKVWIELVKDVHNLGCLVIVRFKEHRAFTVFQPFGIYCIGIGKQLDNPVIKTLAAFFQRGHIALGNVYFLPEFLLRQTEGMAHFQETAADILIHSYKLTRKTAEKQGLEENGFIKDTKYPNKI